MSSSFHVFFDGTPQLRGHVCAYHRDLAQAMFCPDDDNEQTGDCRHVQHRSCDCEQAWPCVVCPTGYSSGHPLEEWWLLNEVGD